MAYIYLDTMLGLRDTTVSKRMVAASWIIETIVGGRLPNYSSKY